MTSKKKKSSAADNLIESLMDDLKDIPSGTTSSIEEDSFIRRINNGEMGIPMLNQSDSIISPTMDNDSANKDQQSKENFISAPLKKVNLNEIKIDPTFDEKTMAFPSEEAIVKVEGFQTNSPSGTDDKTLAVTGFGNLRNNKVAKPAADIKVSVGKFRNDKVPSNLMTSVDASLAQSENLKLAQQRISELENELEILRGENDELASAGDIVRSQVDSLNARIGALEREKAEIRDSAQSEILLLKGGIQFKENEAAKARIKIEELEARLKQDFKKIRVRERELENRLELLRAEKSALVRSKDDYILNQKRKIDQLTQEIDNYRKKCLELNKVIEANQDQVKRTERALRLALTNLETKDEDLSPLKKAD